MASASYVRNNDYLPQQFKPYELPYNAIMQSAQIKEQYFKQNVAAMQAEWGKITGLSPANTINKQNLKKFELEAFDKFQRVAKSDLTVQGNQQLFSQILAPLYDQNNDANKYLLMDDQMSKFYAAQEKLSEKARKTKNGEGWSENNDFFWKSTQRKYMDWAKNGDPSGILQLEANAFIPYYDVQPEMLKLRIACSDRGDSVTPPDNNGYLVKNSTEGASPAQLADCLLTGLSPKAKQQQAIDGYRYYYNDHEALARDYSNYVYGASLKKMNDIETKLLALKNLKVKDKDKLDDYNKALTETTQRFNEAQQDYQEKLKYYNKITEGNEKDFYEKNYAFLSGQTHIQMQALRLGTAFSSLKTDVEYKANPWDMQTRNLLVQQDMQQKKFDHEERMKELEFKNNGFFNPPSGIDYKINEDSDKMSMVNIIKDNHSSLEDAFNTSKQILFATIDQTWGASPENKSEDSKWKYIEMLKAFKPEDLSEEQKEVLAAYDRYNSIKIDFDQSTADIKFMETNMSPEAKKPIQSILQEKKLKNPSDFSPVEISPGVTLTAEDMLKILDGKVVKGIYSKEQNNLISFTGKHKNLYTTIGILSESSFIL